MNKLRAYLSTLFKGTFIKIHATLEQGRSMVPSVYKLSDGMDGLLHFNIDALKIDYSFSTKSIFFKKYIPTG